MLLVTGATGFIGSHLVPALVRKGYRVRALCRRREDAAKLPKGVEVYVGDVGKPDGLSGALRGVDTVIHLAGMVSYSKPREELFRVNAIGTRNLLERCGGVKRFVLSSSVSVYGEIRGEADEGYPVSPRTPYGESKLSAEKFVEKSGIRSSILRIAPVYGEGSPSWRKNLRLMDRGFPVPGTGNLTHVVHVSDVVQAFVKAAQKGEGIYNIAGKEPVRFRDFAGMLMDGLGRKRRFWPPFLVGILARITGMKSYLDVLTMNRNYDIGRAQRELGYRPGADLAKETARMVDWYRKSA